MAGLINIKSLRDGILIRLDENADFQSLYNEVCEKFSQSAQFFKDAKVVVSFEGRPLTEDEENELVNAITLNSDLSVLCIVGDDEAKNNRFIKAKNLFINSSDTSGGQFYRGDVKAHEKLESDFGITILGDVNPGATVVSKGNIIVLGTLYGTAHAGSAGDTDAFIATLDMKSARVQIADVASEVILRSSVFSKNKIIPRLSYMDGRKITTEEITRDLLNYLSRK